MKLVISASAIALMLVLVVGCAKDKKAADIGAKNNTMATDITPLPAPAPAYQPTATPAVTETPLIIPAPAPAPATAAPVVKAEKNKTHTVSSSKVYVVKKGDNLTKVAKVHHTTLKKILEANPGLDANHIKAGQKINMP